METFVKEKSHSMNKSGVMVHFWTRRSVYSAALRREMNDRLVKKAISKNVNRRVIACSEHDCESVDLISQTLRHRYPHRYQTHIFDFSFINGVLSRQLIREKWPRITACENIAIGNILNVSNLKVPKAVDFQLVVDNVFSTEKNINRLVKEVFKGCKRDDPCLSTELMYLSQSTATCLDSITSGESSEKCRNVAVGCFGSSNSSSRNLDIFGHLFFSSLQSERKINFDILAFFPSKLAKNILSKKLGKTKFKLFLDLFTERELIANISNESFEFFFKPQDEKPKTMSLIHIKAVDAQEVCKAFGLSQQQVIGMWILFQQLRYSPTRYTANWLELWGVSHLRPLLSQTQLLTPLCDLSVERFIELFTTLSKSAEFLILLESWTSWNNKANVLSEFTPTSAPETLVKVDEFRETDSDKLETYPLLLRAR